MESHSYKGIVIKVRRHLNLYFQLYVQCPPFEKGHQLHSPSHTCLSHVLESTVEEMCLPSDGAYVQRTNYPSTLAKKFPSQPLQLQQYPISHPCSHKNPTPSKQKKTRTKSRVCLRLFLFLFFFFFFFFFFLGCGCTHKSQDV